MAEYLPETLIQTFLKKLGQVDLRHFSEDSYATQYLHSLIAHRAYYLHIYAQVLDCLLHHAAKARTEMVLVDYGAGNGLLGLFAKHCGYKEVYLSDHNPAVVSTAALLSRLMEIPLDGIIVGDSDAVLDFFHNRARPDAVIGTDVIEHIYSLERFFRDMAVLNPQLVTVFTTASVTANRWKSRQLRKLQYRDEHVDSNAFHALVSDPYPGMPYLEKRTRIITHHFPALTKEEIQRLAIATRGYNTPDILMAVEKFKRENILPESLLHPTNTCDPVTGSWTERLLTVEAYRQIYASAGFKLQVYNGFYNVWQDRFKKWMFGWLNCVIRLTGKSGRCIAPFITLAGAPSLEKDGICSIKNTSR